MSIPTSRRRFLQVAGSSVFVSGIAPAILGAADKAGTRPVVIGEGEHRYECHHGWGELPREIVWKNTHGTAIDREGLIYITHQGSAQAPCDTVVVFDPDGKFVRSFGKEYAGGGHGISIREEDGTDYLYLSNTGLKSVVKCTTQGEVVWSKLTPTELHLYDPPTPAQIKAAQENGQPAPKTPTYSPTNVCFGVNGDFYIGDGYGASYIHQYNRNGNWMRSWGGIGTAAGRMKTPHGLWLDTRGGTPRLVVADRANARLQYFSLEGRPLEIFQGIKADQKERDGTREILAGADGLKIPVTNVYGLSFPADLETRGELLLVPDLHARILLMNGENKIVANLGFDEAWTAKVLDGFKIRLQPESWEAGRFVHPHDACFDQQGNIYVAEWVDRGRVTFLKRV